MKTITKDEYKKALETYISSKIDVFESPDNRDKFEWRFIEGMPSPAQPDMTRYASREAAMNSAVVQVQQKKGEALKIAKNDTSEWMKYNGYKLA